MKNCYNHQVRILEWIRDSDRGSGKVEITMFTEDMVILTKTYSEFINATKKQRKVKILQLTRDDLACLMLNNYVMVTSNKRKKRFYVTLKKEI